MNKQETDTDTAYAQFLTADADGIEVQGYDAPFVTLTWEEWLSMQAQMVQRFARFQRAIEYKQAKVATQIAREVVEMGMKWLEEASEWIGIRPG